MKIYVERPLKGYAYTDGEVHDMPDDHAEDFLDVGRGYEAEDNKPDSSNTKAEIKEYLESEGIEYTESMLKDELLELV